MQAELTHNEFGEIGVKVLYSTNEMMLSHQHVDQLWNTFYKIKTVSNWVHDTFIVEYYPEPDGITRLLRYFKLLKEDETFETGLKDDGKEYVCPICIKRFTLADPGNLRPADYIIAVIAHVEIHLRVLKQALTDEALRKLILKEN